MKTKFNVLRTFMMAASIFMISCQKDSVTPASLDNTQWIFKDYQENKLPSKFQNQATLSFKPEDQSYVVSGNSFINRYQAKLALNKTNSVIVNELSSTEKFGLEDDERLAEESYFDNLKHAQYVEFTDQELKIFIGEKSNPKDVMVYQRKD